jgi:hypothetical protein
MNATLAGFFKKRIKKRHSDQETIDDESVKTESDKLSDNDIKEAE